VVAIVLRGVILHELAVDRRAVDVDRCAVLAVGVVLVRAASVPGEAFELRLDAQ
jgi:hypothetical protein